MNTPPPTSRDCLLRKVKESSLPAVQRRLLEGTHCESGFRLMAAPVPARFDTRLLVEGTGGEVMISALLSTYRGREMGGEPFVGGVELLFDQRNDRFGFVQLILSPGRAPVFKEFAPYPETKTTLPSLPTVLRWGFEPVASVNKSMFRTHRVVFYAVFREEELFAHGEVIGFNMSVDDGSAGEMSSWSFLAGNGVPDANSLGRLHRKPRTMKQAPALPEVAPAKSFRVSITNDTPMLICNRPYTPASLDAEMRHVRSLGVERLHWIDYSRFDSFWQLPPWAANYQETVRQCGDLLKAACKAAKKHKVALVPDFKLFDLAFASKRLDPAGLSGVDTTPGIDRMPLLCIPEMVGNEDAFIQTNPAWRREPAFPIHTLRLYSLEPFTAPEGVRLFQSEDNDLYRAIRGGFSVGAVRKVSRPNRGWSPAGVTRLEGKHTAWMLEIRGLKLTRPFLRVELPGAQGRLFHREFALVEAIGTNGQEAPFLIRSGSGAKGDAHQWFDFAGGWPGWNNYNDPVCDYAAISPQQFGLAFIEPQTVPGILEPTHPKAQEIWLNRVDAYLRYDIAGLGLRTLCHHLAVNSWLKYAFSPAVIDAFSKEYGRPPEPTEADYAAVRRLRGKAFGEFLAKASARIRAKGKRVIFQIETGSELPPERESRMAIWYDYESWIASGLFDELHVRSITGHSPWLREVILPLAHKHGVEVHLITRNLAMGYSMSDLVGIRDTVAHARALGYHGLNFYEAANLYETTECDTILSRGFGSKAVLEAQALAKEVEVPKPWFEI